MKFWGCLIQGSGQMADALAHKGAGGDQFVACGLPIKWASLIFLGKATRRERCTCDLLDSIPR